MVEHRNIKYTDLRRLILQNKIQLAGNKKLRIYGSLQCTAGKRMKKDNRIFFTTKEEAIRMGFRPCGKCLQSAFKNWKEHGAV
jgi:methylphosphotriester-DNA--protein-cysteine methyltransferase